MGNIVFSRPDNRCLMGDITDLHFGSKAKAKKKKKTFKARKRVCGVGVKHFAQNAQFTIVG